MILRTDSLHYNVGSSDKVYNVFIQDSSANPGFYDVIVSYGRRGSSLTFDTKIAGTNFDHATKTANKIVKEKTAKGYEPTGSTTSEPGKMPEPATSAVSELMPQLLNDAKSVEECLDDPMWVAQEKYDGQRRMIVVKAGQVQDAYGVNKTGKRVPLSSVIIASLDPDMEDAIIDGEVIGDTLFAFDLLTDKDQRAEFYTRRLSALRYLDFGPNIQVVHTAETNAAKRELFERLRDEGREGIVFKRSDAAYEAGRPNSCGNQLKYKFVQSATCIVSGHTAGKRSVELRMYKPNAVSSIIVGKVTIPPNFDIPAIDAFVEVRYLYAYKNGSLYQPVYLGERDDVGTNDCIITQLKYKAEEAVAQ